MNATLKLFQWLPRILGLLAILFISMFALDSFTPGAPLWLQIQAFLIHLIPSFFLLGILIIAWKWQLIGGLLFLVTGLSFIPFVYGHNYSMNHSVWASLGVLLIINMPFIIVGALFLTSSILTRRTARKK